METILVVESEPADLLAMALVLRSFGYGVLEADSPEEAIRACQESPEPIRLMVTEAVLDNTDASELVARLRSPYPHMRALLISDVATLDLGDTGTEGCAYLRKPFHVDDLAAGVELLLAEPKAPPSVKAMSPIAAIRNGWQKTVAAARHLQTRMAPSLSSLGDVAAGMRAAVQWSCLAVILIVVPIVILFTRGRSLPISPKVVAPHSLALTLTGEGDRLHLTWDSASPAIRLGRCGVLWIADGIIQRRITLNAADMRVGSLFYWPTTKDLSVALNIADTNTSCADPDSTLSALSVAELADPVPSKRRANTAHFSQGQNGKSGVRRHQIRSDRAQRVTDNADRVSSTPSSVPVSPNVTADSIQGGPSPRRPAIDDQLVAAAASPVSQPAPEPFSSVTMEADTQSHPGGLRPLLRRLRPQSEFEPPMPLHQSTPMVGDDLRRHLRSEVPLDVRVYVNKSGKVDYAELLSDITDANRDLATVAVFDARHWEFTPARSGKRIVPGRAILHYRFGHPAVAMSHDLK
jgi:CheY-like chemotaxis protein